MDSVPSGNLSITHISKFRNHTEHSNTVQWTLRLLEIPYCPFSSVKSFGQPTAHSLTWCLLKILLLLTLVSKISIHWTLSYSSTEHTISLLWTLCLLEILLLFPHQSTHHPLETCPSMNSVSTRGTVNIYETKSAAMERASKGKIKEGRKILLASSHWNIEWTTTRFINKYGMAMKAKQKGRHLIWSWAVASATTS